MTFDRIKNATPLMHALDAAIRGELHDIPHPFHHLRCPKCCQPEVLPFLAWEASVDHWNDRWPEAVKRQVVIDAFEVHRRKGTVGAVRRALASVLTTAEFQEWFQTGDAPHTFRITATPPDARLLINDNSGVIYSAALIRELRNVVDAAKPLRSHYTLTLKGKGLGALHIGGAGAGQNIMRARAKANHRDHSGSSEIYFGGAAASQTISRARGLARHRTHGGVAAINLSGAGFSQTISRARFMAVLP